MFTYHPLPMSEWGSLPAIIPDGRREKTETRAETSQSTQPRSTVGLMLMSQTMDQQHETNSPEMVIFESPT